MEQVECGQKCLRWQRSLDAVGNRFDEPFASTRPVAGTFPAVRAAADACPAGRRHGGPGAARGRGKRRAVAREGPIPARTPAACPGRKPECGRFANRAGRKIRYRFGSKTGPVPIGLVVFGPLGFQATPRRTGPPQPALATGRRSRTGKRPRAGTSTGQRPASRWPKHARARNPGFGQRAAIFPAAGAARGKGFPAGGPAVPSARQPARAGPVGPCHRASTAHCPVSAARPSFGLRGPGATGSRPSADVARAGKLGRTKRCATSAASASDFAATTATARSNDKASSGCLG